MTSCDVQGGIGLPADEARGRNVIDENGGLQDSECDRPELVDSDDEDEPVVERIEHRISENPVTWGDLSANEIFERVTKLLEGTEEKAAARRAEILQSDDADADDAEILKILEAQIMPIEYADTPDEVLNTTREVKVKIAADSGAVDHIANPANIPGDAKLRMPSSGRLRNFVAANGDPIKNHGEAKVMLHTAEGTNVGNIFQVADVCRPIHSASKVCDAGHEWLFTATEAVVVSAGALSRFLKSEQALATYPREGGLYVATMTARADDGDLAEGFARPGIAQ